MQKIYEKLAAIQAELHSPKSEYNSFGKYSYRTAEAILEAVKPFLKAQGCVLNCSDELLLIGDRYYIKATATIVAVEDGSSVSTTAWAREELDKKGMDQSQVTGASSSYARKYALNGLLAIDNTPDSDATNVGDGAATKDQAKKPIKKVAKTAQETSSPAGQGNVSAKKPEAPAPGSENWNRWVVAIATGAPSKTGQKVDWLEAFKATYCWDMDLIALLEEDVFNYRIDKNIKAGSTSQQA